MQKKFTLKAPFQPSGQQPNAIQGLVDGLNDGLRYQTLLGVTGSGKTFTVANVIERVQRPALVMAPNKTLAAQLYAELREFFPDNAVEYFVSYYDYYQPEAYVPSRDIFIEKDYAVISSFEEDASDFVLKVNELMQQGWIISGGISSSNNKIFQALVKVSK